MESLPYRMIRNEPARFEALLATEGMLILNKGGKPFAIMLDASSDSLEATMRLVSQIRAQLAVSRMRQTARSGELEKLSLDDLQAEIDAVRSERAVE